MILLLIYVLLSSCGLILFKLGSENINFSFVNNLLKGQISIIAIIGLCCYVSSFILGLIVFSKAEKISNIFPLSVALTQFLILALSYFILKENINQNTLISVVFLIIAVYFGAKQ